VINYFLLKLTLKLYLVILTKKLSLLIISILVKNINNFNFSKKLLIHLMKFNENTSSHINFLKIEIKLKLKKLND